MWIYLNQKDMITLYLSNVNSIKSVQYSNAPAFYTGRLFILTLKGLAGSLASLFRGSELVYPEHRRAPTLPPYPKLGFSP
jgi:hypothetical protein